MESPWYGSPQLWQVSLGRSWKNPARSNSTGVPLVGSVEADVHVPPLVFVDAALYNNLMLNIFSGMGLVGKLSFARAVGIALDGLVGLSWQPAMPYRPLAAQEYNWYEWRN